MKSLFTKLGVLLLGATFAVVGCTDFAEDIREVSDKVDNNMADVTVSTEALDDAIEDLKAQQAADKAAAETALAGLKTSLEGKIQTDIAAAEAKLEAAYKAADQVVTTGYTNADAALKAELVEKINEAKKAAEDANKTLEDALEAADKAIEDAYKAEDVKINASIAALESKLNTEVARVEGLVNAVDAKFKGFEEAYKNADIILDGKIADLSAELKKVDEAYKLADDAIKAAYEAADAAINKRIDDAEKLIADLQKADTDLQAAIDANKKSAEDAIKAEADAREAAINGLTQLHNNDKQTLLDAIKVNSEAIAAEITAREEADKKLQANIDAANDALAQAKKDLEDADKELDAAIKANDKDIEALQNRATALEARVDALESWKTTAQQEIDKNKADIAKLTGDLALLDAAYKAADKALQDNIDKVNAALNEFKTQVDETYAKKTDLDAAKTELKGLVTALEGKVNTQRTELEKMITDLDDELSNLIAANDAAIKAEVTARENAVKAVEDALAQAKKDLEAADKTNKEELEGKISNLKKELEDAIAAEKKVLEDAIAAEKKAREDAIKEVNKLIDAVEADVESLKKEDIALDGRLDVLEAWKETATKQITDLAADLAGIESKLEEIQELVDSLFNQIQSVVYKPTHADGKARIDYATLEGAILEGNSVITYKVYPKKHVETIKKAFNEGLLTLAYDLESVTKAGEPALEVVSVDKGAKDGELAVTVKASNLGATAFYDPAATLSYSAALVLSYGAENFSTEYTNLVAATTPTAYTFDLYVNDVLYAAAEDQTIEYAATNPELWTKTVLNGLNVKFSDGATKYVPADFFEIYPLAEAMFVEETPVITNPDDIFVSGKDANGYVTAYLDESKVAAANVTKIFNVKYGYTFNSVTKNAEGNIEIVAFPWAIQIDKKDAGVTYPLQLPYTDDKVVEVLPDYEISFINAGVSKTEKQLVEEGYCVKVDTLDVVTAVTDAKGGATADLFTVAKIDDKEVAPVQVSLAKDNGVNKAVAANVGTIFNVKYSFDYKVGTETITAAESIDADVKIEKTMYSFDVTVPEIQWTYAPDATADAAIAGGYCSRVLEYANDEAGIISAAYRTGSADKALMNGALTIEEVLAAGTVTEITVGTDTYTGVAIADSPIKFSAGTPADKKVEVQLEKLAWGAYDGQTGKEYVASATYELSSAIVNINLTASTRDRNRNAIEIDLGEKSVVYAANLVVDPTTEIPLGLNDALVANKNLGSATSVDDALLTQVLNAAVATNYVTYVDDAHKRENATAMKTGLQFADALGVACFDKVTYGYHYGNLTNTSLGYTNGSIVPKLYAYSASFTTWYGQVVNVALDFKLEDPKYDFAPVYQYIQGTAADGYYVQVNPEYTYEITDPTKLVDFSVKQVNLNASFDVMNGDVKMDAAAMASASLVKKFEMNNFGDANITFADAPVNTIIDYSGSEPFVNVKGSLTIENDYSGTKTYYPIAETIFTGDFETFQVHKYDPIAENITILENKDEQGVLITDAKIYEFHVLDNFSLKDKLGNELIDPSETDGANAWVVGAPKNKISNGVSVASIYDLTATYELKVTSPTTGIVPTGIIVDSTNGKITIDNSSQIVFANPVVIQAKVTITYPQGKRESSYVTYTFGDK